MYKRAIILSLCLFTLCGLGIGFGPGTAFGMVTAEPPGPVEEPPPGYVPPQGPPPVPAVENQDRGGQGSGKPEGRRFYMSTPDGEIKGKQ